MWHAASSSLLGVRRRAFQCAGCRGNQRQPTLSKRIPQRKLLHSRRGQSSAIDAQRSSREIVAERGRIGIEAHGIGNLEDFPGELEAVPLGYAPGFAHTGVDAKVAVAAEIVALARLARIWNPDRIALADDSVV